MKKLQLLSKRLNKRGFETETFESGDSERNALTAYIYLTSANAISIDGHILNIDETENRIAATCFGPKRVIYIIGKNKIAGTLDDAMRRA